MNGISSKAAGGLENKKKYNGIEFDEDFDLDTYEAYYRSLDPQTGRWWQIDPKIESMEAWSPYASNYDNPIIFSDPLGDEPEDDGGCCGGPTLITPVAINKIGEGIVDATRKGLVLLGSGLNGVLHELSGGLFPRDGLIGNFQTTPEIKGAINTATDAGQGVGIAIEIGAASKSGTSSPGMELALVNGPKIPVGKSLVAPSSLISQNGKVNAEGAKGKDRVGNQKPGEKALNQAEGIGKAQDAAKKNKASGQKKQTAINQTKKSDDNLKNVLKNIKNLKDANENF